MKKSSLLEEWKRTLNRPHLVSATIPPRMGMAGEERRGSRSGRRRQFEF